MGERVQIRGGGWVTLAPRPRLSRRIVAAPLRWILSGAIAVATRLSVEHWLDMWPISPVFWWCEMMADRIAPSDADRLFDAILLADEETTKRFNGAAGL